jgi:peptide/nickel transport system permease protein
MRFWREVIKSKSMILGSVIVLLFVLTAIFAPFLAPNDPYKPSFGHRFDPPFWYPGGTTQYPLGRDALGRDIFSRIIYGARISLMVGIFSALTAGIIGVLLGIVGGYYKGKIDALVTLSIDVMLSFPFILLALLVIALWGSGLLKIIVILGITSWPAFARPIRASVLSLYERDFIHAARAVGCGDFRIFLVHLIPNIMSITTVIFSIQVGRAILYESFLSFLGLGIPPPIPSWGVMIGEARDYLLNLPWLATFPGVAIFLAVLGFNLLGDGLRDIMDPYLRKNI